MDKNNNKKLLDIFEDDELGLLDVKPKSSVTNEDDRLVVSFQEIVDFYKINNREPELGSSVKEASLYYRLKGIRDNEAKKNTLTEFDAYDLLKIEDDEKSFVETEKTFQINKEMKTINDILNDDDFGILESGAENIFTIEHVPKETTMPDYVASRKSCKDFEKYEHLFIQCQVDLASGERKLLPFKNEQQIERNCYYVLKGVLLYVADVGKRKMEKGKVNARLRCIFENGTESDMLLRSLSAELYKHGRRVTEHVGKLLNEFNNISEEDEETGYIYILESKSRNSEIQSINNLFKIGYSKIRVEERIKKAEQEPTYLMAPVSIVSVYQCYNMNPQKLEQLLHNFFGNTCLNIDVYDNKGLRHTPREWFIAPLPIIEQAIQFIINGEIINYKYDSDRKEIIGK
ncbi:GIY-YIG nuclease family protein [Paenibacillus alkaliterrae]|uniref:GIY-YIG nuclease family protein n=1 Tax=Paenibacillus alkaliterrae TaxID=320909 RepID=UPI001F4783B3|nr:GIY-YIG nuclease family protein [Paenibacillus alkaliterrae]MCF2941033.1 GIY-YIG nuclease family protein [Paenibacillus alkaliterrae]